MAGHSHWKQIKHHKGAADQKRGLLFSKLVKAIQVAAKGEPNPQFNPRLRDAIEKAKQNNVPNENIDRAIRKTEEAKDLEEITVEAYGPGGTACVIEAVTDNRNRTIAEIKKILGDFEAKIANPGSVLWGFEKEVGGWKAKFPQALSEKDETKCNELVETLLEQEDVQNVTTNSEKKTS
jgi:YebC/PmpR family DNA-binding regulatory protein